MQTSLEYTSTVLLCRQPSLTYPTFLCGRAPSRTAGRHLRPRGTLQEAELFGRPAGKCSARACRLQAVSAGMRVDTQLPALSAALCAGPAGCTWADTEPAPRAPVLAGPPRCHTQMSSKLFQVSNPAFPDHPFLCLEQAEAPRQQEQAWCRDLSRSRGTAPFSL